MNDRKLAIVMPVWNNWRYTKKTIKMLKSLPEDHTLIVVDNGSTDQTKDLETDPSPEYDHVIALRNSENLGFAKACNIGFAEALSLRFENVMFLNNDIKVVDDFQTWTQPLIEAASSGKIVGPTVGCLDGNLNFICEASKWPSRGFGYLSGWNVTASTETWLKLVLEGEQGPFSTEFGIAYFEDTDLGFRAKELGIEAGLVSVPVRHFGKATSKNLGTNNLYAKAKQIFVAKWKGRV